MKITSAYTEIKAHAKLNLYLDITGRRPDGYHELETVMQQLSLSDTVKIRVGEGGKITVGSDAKNIPTDETNIAARAARLFSRLTALSFSADIFIEKQIPVEAGMGGSSADGAAALIGLNELFGKPYSVKELSEIGALLGADVPFCIVGGTKSCTGIGEKIEAMKPFPECAFLVVKPDFSCNTAAAYRKYDEKGLPPYGRFSEFKKDCEIGADTAAKGLYNVFERLYADNRIEEIKRQLISAGALGASMTGSGSAVFGIFGNMTDAENAAKNVPDGVKILTKPEKGLEK